MAAVLFWMLSCCAQVLAFCSQALEYAHGEVKMKPSATWCGMLLSTSQEKSALKLLPTFPGSGKFFWIWKESLPSVIGVHQEKSMAVSTKSRKAEQTLPQKFLQDSWFFSCDHPSAPPHLRHTVSFHQSCSEKSCTCASSSYQALISLREWAWVRA